jgi:hypothetical protein
MAAMAYSPTTRTPEPMLHHIQVAAFLEASKAPAESPICHLLLTWAAKTIETMPSGQQQRMVARIAPTRWFGGGGPVGAE